MPGGWLDKGEEFAACARRELLEETGLDLGSAKSRTAPFVANNIDMDGVHSVTIFEHLKPTWTEDREAKIMEPDKCAEWRWCRVDELPSPLFPPLAALVSSHYWQREIAVTTMLGAFPAELEPGAE